MTEVYLNEIVVRELAPRSIAQLSFSPTPRAYTLLGLGGLALELEVLGVTTGRRVVFPEDYPSLRGIGLTLFPWDEPVPVYVGEIVRVSLRNGSTEPVKVALTLYAELDDAAARVRAADTVDAVAEAITAELVDAPPAEALRNQVEHAQQVIDDVERASATVARTFETLDETLKAFGYEDLRRYVLEKVAALEKARKMLRALSDQLDQVREQKTADAVRRYMLQAQHMRTEIDKLSRGEV